MTKILKSIGLVGLAGLLALTAVAPASAQPWFGPGFYRPYAFSPFRPAFGPFFWPGRPFFRPGFRTYRRWGFYRRYDPSAAIASGVIGGVFGAIAGSALRSNSHVVRCQRAYRSYVPATDSFFGYDGLRHRCLL